MGVPMVLKKFTLKHVSTTLYFGTDSIKNLSKHVEEYRKIVIVTGKRSAELSGALKDVKDLLSAKGIDYKLFNGITPNPWVSQADELAEKIWRESPDAVIAIGGGSIIDTTKVASVIATRGGRAIDYLPSRLRIWGHIPLIAVNLTHGTGTEIDRYAVLTTDDTREKRGCVIAYPDISFDDPKYTLSLPLNQTIYTSLDAFYHSYESVTSKIASPYIELLTRESISMINKWLPKAIDNLKNLEARYWLLYSSMIAGIAIDTSSTHVVHAIEHALSGLKPELAHGAGLAVIGPAAAFYIHKAVPVESAEALRIIEPSIKPTADDAPKAEKAIKEFQSSVGFDERLSDYGFAEKDIPKIISLVEGSLRYLLENTPFEVTEDILKDILTKSL